MKRAENATISTGTITTTAGTAGITIYKACKHGRKANNSIIISSPTITAEKIERFIQILKPRQEKESIHC